MRARRWGRAGLLGLATLAALPTVAGAVPTLSGEFDVGGDPKRLTVGADGSAWVSVPGVGRDTVRVTNAGVVTPFDLANIDNNQGPAGLVTATDGRIWTTVAGGVVSFDPADPTGTELLLAIPALVTPDDLTFGPGGFLYAVGTDGGGVARLFVVNTTAVAGGVLINAGGTPVAGLQSPKGITAATDGRLYIGDFAGQQVVSVNAAGADPVAYPVGGGVQGVGAGPAGQVAYTVPNLILGRLVAGGTPQPTTVLGSDSFSIKFAADSAYWAPGFVSAKAIRLTVDGTATEPIGFGGVNPGPRHVAVGPDNTVWFALEFPEQPDFGKVARIAGVDPPPPPPPPPPVDPGGGTTPPPGGGGTPPVDPPLTPLRPALTGVLAPRALTAGRVLTLRATVTSTQTTRLVATIARRLPGRRAASGRCVAPRPALAGRRACIRFVPVTGIVRRATVTGTAGRVVIRTGPGRGRLKAGTYRIGVRVISATGLRSPLRTRIVTVRPA